MIVLDVYGDDVVRIRPYKAMCLLCSLGGVENLPDPQGVAEIREIIRENPERPLALCCNIGGMFSYQNPGNAQDTTEGAGYNLKRDIDILLRMDLPPGAIMPARIALKRLAGAVRTPMGICAYGRVTSEEWRGCPRAATGVYEKAIEAGLREILPPRDKAAMEADKARSLKDMHAAGAIRIRPHILACAVAQYGNGLRPPFADDNLPEFLQLALECPDIPVTLVEGADWMMCGPCPARLDEANDCYGGIQATQGLYNTLKDLNVLQAAGWSYGMTLPARDIMRQLFERIPDIEGVCAFDREINSQSVWRDGCGRATSPCPGYRIGREQLIEAFGLSVLASGHGDGGEPGHTAR